MNLLDIFFMPINLLKKYLNDIKNTKRNEQIKILEEMQKKTFEINMEKFKKLK